MGLVAVASLHGSPGATALATALAGRAHGAGEATLLVEADPDGGVLAARFDLGLRPCLTDLAGAARRGIAAADLGRFTQVVGPGVPVVVAHPSADQTGAALRSAAAPLATALTALAGTVVVDLGRWRPGSPAAPLAHVATRVLLVVHPVLEQIAQVVHAAEAAVDGTVSSGRIGLVLVGTRPYSARQVTEVVAGSAVEVVATVPADAAVSADPFAVSTRRRDPWTAAIDEVRRALATDPVSAQPGSPPAA